MLNNLLLLFTNFASNAKYRRQTFVGVHDLSPKVEGPVILRLGRSTQKQWQFLCAIKFALIVSLNL